MALVGGKICTDIDLWRMLSCSNIACWDVDLMTGSSPQCLQSQISDPFWQDGPAAGCRVLLLCCCQPVAAVTCGSSGTLCHMGLCPHCLLLSREVWKSQCWPVIMISIIIVQGFCSTPAKKKFFVFERLACSVQPESICRRGIYMSLSGFVQKWGCEEGFCQQYMYCMHQWEARTEYRAVATVLVVKTGWSLVAGST